MGLMEKFADPALFGSLSFSEKMAGSAITMLMGMGITFLILCILWGFVAVMGKAMDSMQKEARESSDAKAGGASQEEARSAASPAEADMQAQLGDEVIAAVIAAAISAYRESGGTGNLAVKKIRRVSGDTNPWVSAARGACIESRKR